MKIILEIEGLKKYYGRPGNQTKALDGISFQAAEGEFLGIMGTPIRICRKRLKFWLVRVKIALYEQKPIQRIRKRWNEKSKEKKITNQNRNG